MTQSIPASFFFAAIGRFLRSIQQELPRRQTARGVISLGITPGELFARSLPNRRIFLAHAKLPDPLSRRHLLEGGLDQAKARAYGEAYLAADREIEAIDFLELAGARELLEGLQTVALERGDVFLMRSASRAMRDEPSAATWRSLAETATALGRERDSEAALRLATVGE